MRRSFNMRSGVKRRALVVVAAAGALAAGGGLSAVAAAAPQAHASAKAITANEINYPTAHGPHGTTLMLQPVCNGGHSGLDAQFGRSSSSAALTHLYTGPLTCKASGDFRHIELLAHWGDAVVGSVVLVQQGKSRVSHSRLDAHCEATLTKRSYAAVGSVNVRIHTSAVGSYHLAPTKLAEESYVLPSCFVTILGGIGGTTGTGGITTIGSSLVRAHAATTGTGTTPTGTGTSPVTFTSPAVTPPVDAADDGVQLSAGPARGPSVSGLALGTDEGSLANLTETQHDLDVHGVTDDVELIDMTANPFTVTAGLQSGTVDLRTSMSTGGFTYTSTGVCRDDKYGTKGALSGSVTVHDPITGPFTVTGARLGQTATASYVGDDVPDGC